MADVVHEFYSDSSINYSTLKAGITVATTGSSETAVIRDVAISATRGIKLQIGGITVAQSEGSANLSGTEIMKASQTMTALPKDTPLWTGITAKQYSSTSDTSGATKYWKNDLSSHAYIWKAPDGQNRLAFTNRNDTYFRGNNSAITALGQVSGASNYVESFPADTLFNKPEKDWYYTTSIYRAMANTGYNQLYYYDHSADSSTVVKSASGSHKEWWAGMSNRYIVGRRSNLYGWQYLDTTDNSSADVASIDTNSTDRNYQFDGELGSYSILDNYLLISPGGHYSYLYLANITTGKMCRFTTGNGYTLPFTRSDQFSNGHFRPQLARNTGGTYFVLKPYIRETSYSASYPYYGLNIVSLGSNPQAIIDSSWDSPTGYTNMTNWSPSPTDTYLGYSAFMTSSSRYDNYSDGSSFCPLKKLTPTDSTARYWLYMYQSYSYIIDLDNVSGNGDDFITPLQWTRGGSNTNSLCQNMGQVTSWRPHYSESTIGGSYGNIGIRVTGIKTT